MQTDGKIYCLLRLQDSILTQMTNTQNDYTTQSNLEVQCNLYQITNGIFHKTRTKNFKICMEAQKTSNSQSNPEEETQSWRDQAS